MNLQDRDGRLRADELGRLARLAESRDQLMLPGGAFYQSAAGQVIVPAATSTDQGFEFSGAKVLRTSGDITLAVSGQNYDIEFDAGGPAYNPSGWWDPADPKKLSLPQDHDGFYMIGAQAKFEGAGTGVWTPYLRVTYRGTDIAAWAQGVTVTGAGITYVQVFTSYALLLAGDYLELAAQQVTSSGSPTVTVLASTINYPAFWVAGWKSGS